MTAKQIQHLLGYLGYYTGAVDGQLGKESRGAVIAFQRADGLDADGIAGVKTEAALKDAVAHDRVKNVAPSVQAPGRYVARYFTRNELKCKCGGKYCNGFPVEPSDDLQRVLDAIRERTGKPIYINSGIRCKEHNANVGGVSNSQHLLGTAADIRCPGITTIELAAIAEEVMPKTGGIGTYYDFVHVDVRKAKARWKG